MCFHSISQRLLPLNVPNRRDKARSIKLIPFVVWKVLDWDLNILKVRKNKRLQRFCSLVRKVLNTNQGKLVVSAEFLANSSLPCKFIRNNYI